MSARTAGDQARPPAPGLQWIKSSLSFANGNCVQVARLPDGQIGVRDSKNPRQPILRFTPAQWHAFLAGARRGEFSSPGSWH
jgi:hypothetical protein